MKKMILVLLMLMLFISGCDTFFTLNTLVIDDKTGEPISGAKGMFMNEPESAWATMTIEKEGYATWSTQFRGAPRSLLVIRLVTCEKSSE